MLPMTLIYYLVGFTRNNHNINKKAISVLKGALTKRMSFAIMDLWLSNIAPCHCHTKCANKGIKDASDNKIIKYNT